MSGDVQPRKRKNKGKKKEDAGGEEDIFSSLKNSSDEVIHVHKDIGCGGNVLTKLIFFFILATIGVMVGVILLEYRGSSDEDTTSAVDSPWSVTFQHWVDDDADKHHNSEERHRIISSENGSKSNFVDTDSLEEIPDEELFPEAREALRKEREELAKQEEQEKEEQEKEESKDEGFVEKESNNDENEEETEGTGEDPESFISESSVVTGGMEEEVKKEVKTQVPVGKMETLLPAATTVPSIPDLPAPTQEHTDDSPAADDETGDEVEAEDEEESELEIDKEKFKELIAKYGQDTPESSDIEPSDEEIHKSSGGEESAGDEAEEESPAEIVSGDERTSEDELKEWAGIKKSDIEKMTKLDSESEGDVEPEDEEEEESEDESSPPPPPPYHSAQRQRGGPNDIENLYPNDLITNDDDWAIREELDKADEEFNYEEFYF